MSPFPTRTHTCGELRLHNVGERVVLCGWVQKLRTISADLYFLPLRDSYGTTQLVYRSSSDPEKSHLLKDELLKLSPESVICIEGIVAKRPVETINKHSMTGEIEIELDKLYWLNPANKLPFAPHEKNIPNEETRMRYRCVDLRRDSLQSNLRKRSLASWTIKDFLVKEGFVEVETPALFKSTPEGAREFIVPTRTKNLFFTLSQSPQQYKQLLMVGGIDKYFQFARCFRDEDLRSDRQPEFTQIDLEMSFASINNIMSLTEGLVNKVWKQVLGVDLNDNLSFPRISYEDAMNKYGSDKPDTRYDLEIKDISKFVPGMSELSEHIIECLIIKNGRILTGSEIKFLKTLNHGFELPAERIISDSRPEFIKITPDNINSWLLESIITRYASHISQMQEAATNELGVEVGDLMIINKRRRITEGNWTLLGRLRSHVAGILESKGVLKIPSSKYNFLWIESFPLFTRDRENNKLVSTHHPFTAPVLDDLKLLLTEPEKVRGQHYDLVVNGVEIGGGSVRIHSPLLQKIILDDILKMSRAKKSEFDHLINALGYGCPPHGGIALGLDRIMSVICNTSSIREVMAFPKVASGADLSVSSPSELSKEKIREYKVDVLEEKDDKEIIDDITIGRSWPTMSLRDVTYTKVEMC
ncbi:Aspartyl-tRNA synthetase [Gigaspora margarita]|uniref:Aspartyl-tRNA synthetase n=1 Tax=Gigaspora margarita TaxID=4874 RepID=A0A8H3XEF2_GIGMA|nr:Aspartyl-tRNA synthetase [Gigaspora margarita]